MKLSIIIPVYNDYKSLKECLQSIAEQNFKDYEIIVVDDGSNTRIKHGFDHGLTQIKLYRMEHGGAPKARNFGFSKSQGEYIFFCDADVRFLKKDALQKMVKILDKNPDKAFCYSSFKYGWKKFFCGPFDIEKLKKNNYISGNSMLRHSAILTAFRQGHPKGRLKGPWDESLKRFQDWDLWLTIVERGGKGIFIPEYLWKAKSGGAISKWLPSILYKFKFLKSVKDFEKAKEVVKKKHNIH